MKRETIKASKEHEKEFRSTFELHESVSGNPYWQAAYEYAATHKLWPDETNAIGQVLVRRESDEKMQGMRTGSTS